VAFSKWLGRAVAAAVSVACASGGPRLEGHDGQIPARAEDVAETDPVPQPSATALENPAAISENRRELVVLVGGDVNLGRHVGQRLLARPSHDPFAGIRPVLDHADLAWVNLESPLSAQDGQTVHPSEANVFTGPPIGAEAIARAGIRVVSVANNHAWDYGFDGFLETLKGLSAAGVQPVGGSARPGEQYRPVVVSIRGWSIAVLAATGRFNPGELESHEAAPHLANAHDPELTRAVRRARAEHDVVLIGLHVGREYSFFPDHVDRRRFEELVEAGADAVIGHHPHVLQGISWSRHRPLIHSLGNLVFGIHRAHQWTGRGALVRLVFERHAPVSVELCPVAIVHDEPHLLARVGMATRISEHRDHLVQISEPLGGLVAGDPGADGCFRVGPREGVIDRDRSEGPHARSR
jgi:poly-gamma-glutamate capsule biosynthesis protein CapA/YwtB (metallophosphatase superfamily)